MLKSWASFKIIRNFLFQVAFGRYHSLFLLNGKVYSCGFGLDGKLGHNDEKDRSVPQQIQLNYEIVCIATGNAHSVICSYNSVSHKFLRF